MLLDAALFLAGLALLVAGGEGLVWGASALARRLGVSAALVGLTVVAFGTSAPELIVCVLAALEGRQGIAFGNVVGSNIANIGLLLAVSALVRPVVVDSRLLGREIPLLAFATVATLVMAFDARLGAGADTFSRADGILLLLMMALFLYVSAHDVLLPGRRDPLLAEAARAAGEDGTPAAALAAGATLAGLAALAGGAELLVGSASSLARAFGVPEVVIGLTLVAVGTSLPELGACLAAARRGEHGLIVGNLVGSNLFNLLFVLGTTATLVPVGVPAGGERELLMMGVLALLLVPFGLTEQRRVTRAEGLILLALYGVFVYWQVGA